MEVSYEVFFIFYIGEPKLTFLDSCLNVALELLQPQAVADLSLLVCYKISL